MSDGPFRDPMTQKWWTPAMMCAWALWRSPEMIEWAWHINAEQFHEGQAISINSVLWHYRYHDLEKKKHKERHNRRYSDHDINHLDYAVLKIVDLLENEVVHSEGTDPNTGLRRKLTAKDWEGADIGRPWSIDVGRAHDAIYGRYSTSPRMTEVRVGRDDIMDIWPVEVTAVGAEAMVDQAAATSPVGATIGPVKSIPARQAEILRAITDLWPDGNLPAMVADRNVAIIQWHKDRAFTPPSDKTIKRAIEADKIGQ